MADIKDRIEKVLSREFGGSMEEMARAMDLNKVTVFRYKNGDIKPSRRSLNLLQQRRGISTAWVLEGGADDIQYDRTPSSHRSNTSLPLFLEPIENLANPGLVVMRASLETDSGKLAANRYWLRIDEAKDYFERGDIVLIQTCPPHPALGLPLKDQFCILKRDGKLIFDKLRTADVVKSSKVAIVRMALSVQRDIWVDDYGVLEK